MSVTTTADSVIRSESLLTRMDSLLEHAERLARSDMGVAEFHQDVLGELASIVNADGVAVWLCRPQQIGLVFDTRAEQQSEWATRGLELIQNLDDERTVLVPPQVSGRLPNSTEFARCASSVILASSFRLALDVRLPPSAQRGENVGEFVAAVAAIVAEFHRGRQLARLMSELQDRERVAAVCRELHSSLDRERIAAILAHDGAAAVRVDRLCVLLATGDLQPFRLASATAVTELNPRANDCREIETCVAQLRAKKSQVPWSTAAATDSDPNPTRERGSEVIDRLLAETGAKRVRVEPIGPSIGSWDAAVGAILLEQFTEQPSRDDDAEIHELTRHAFVAFRNAARVEEMSWLGRLRASWRRAASRRGLLIASGVVAVALALILVPTDFEIEAPGQVQPERRRNIFAPADGVITQVVVSNGAAVSKSDVLLVMRNAELDLEEQRIRGEIATTTARLDSVRAARVNRGSNNSSSAQLTADEEELKQALTSLNRQVEILTTRQSEQTVKSPLAGRVIRWDLVQSLDSRPVRQGELLLQVADTSGPWELELRIPDRSVRHVLNARQAVANELPVRFIFRMSPRESYAARLSAVNLTTELDHAGELSTPATVALADLKLPELRPGSSVLAKIQCGQKSLGYVWFRELIEFVERHVWF